jgi:hypothetical protein
MVSVGDEVDLLGERNEQIAKVLPDVPTTAEMSGGGQ